MTRVASAATTLTLTAALILVPSGVGSAHPGPKHGTEWNDNNKGSWKEKKQGYRSYEFEGYGKVIEERPDRFVLATGQDRYRVTYDDHTLFKGGDEDDLDRGTKVGVFGDRSGRHVHAEVVHIPQD